MKPKADVEVKQEDVELLRDYVGLLERVRELSDRIPT